MTNHLPGIYILSDSIGETAEMVVRAAASQFNSGNMEIKRVPNISDTQTIDEIINQARVNKFMIAYTLVIEELALHLKKAAENSDVICVDILGPLVSALRSVSKIEPKSIGKSDECDISNGITFSNGHVIAVGDIIYSSIYTELCVS